MPVILLAALGAPLTSRVHQWLYSRGLTEGAGMQWLVMLAAFLVAWAVHRVVLRPWLARSEPPQEQDAAGVPASFVRVMLMRLFLPGLMLFIVWIAAELAEEFNSPRPWYDVVMVLLLAWIVTQGLITCAVFQIKRRISRAVLVVISLAVWLLATLEIAQFLTPVMHLLDKIDFTVGGVRLTLLHIIQAVLVLSVFLIFSGAVVSAFSSWIKTVEGVSPAARVLTEKIFRVVFFTLAIVASLGGLGVDLSSLAWFSGAIGLGIGFGLQKVISNLASGFIILADKSIKPGDVIQVGETYGWIEHLGSRYISVVTRDGVEFLIPNEELISGKVINWSYSNNLVRLKLPVGVAYDTDVEAAMHLMISASLTVPRVLPVPEPTCCLVGFGESAINLELRVWISDPEKGLASVKSNLFVKIWKEFKQRGIEVPYPQRVLHYKPGSETRGDTEESILPVQPPES